MSLPRRPHPSRLRHRTAATAATLALTGALALGASAADGSVTPPAGGSQGSHSSHRNVVWAMTVTGHRVRLAKPRFVPTPVHPEKITHPGRDFMGSGVAARFRGPAARPDSSVPQLPGIDVSSYQGNINWAAVAPHIDFSYAKATEGTYYINPDFDNQYEGPYNAGVIRGAYHFGDPEQLHRPESGRLLRRPRRRLVRRRQDAAGRAGHRVQPLRLGVLRPDPARRWSPGCANFVTEYAWREHVYPVIYSTTDWWSTCTGNYGGFGKYDPLWIANYSASHGGTLPHGWGFYTFWQYADSGSLPGDQDVFNGAYSQLKAIAKG